MRRITLFFVLTIVVVSLLTSAASASYPTKTVEIIVPWSAGGSTDIMARLLAEGLEKELGQRFAVINLPGAGGEIGWTTLSNADKDGYTIGASNLPTLITITLMRPETVEYAVDDFEKIANIVLDPSTFVVPGDSPFQDLGDLIEFARENPKRVTMGNSGVGASSYMDILYFNAIMDLELTPVPFEGDAPLRAALLGGHIMGGDIKISEADPYLEEGQLRVLGVMTEERLPDYPDIPTFLEQGVDMTSASARGIIAPSGVPKDIIDILSDAIEKVVKGDYFTQKAKEMNMPLHYLDSEEYERFFKSQEEFTRVFLETTGQLK